jgi:very-short-patch-repair endonuclease
MIDERMDALARRQHGMVSRVQLHQLGMTESAIRHRRRAGRLFEVEEGVYRLSGALESPRRNAMAAVLGAGADALLSHTSAAALVGTPGFAIEPVTITVPRTRRRRSARRVEQSLALPAHHRRVIDGIPCTSVARTIFDLCGDIDARRAERALDNVLARKWVTVPALWRVLDDLAVQGRAGVVLLRALLTERGGRYVPPESELEARFLDLIREHDLSVPTRQVDLGNSDEWLGRVDFAWRQARLVVEVDGSAFHDGLVDRRADRARDARLTAEGWTVLRFRWADVVDSSAPLARKLRDHLDDDSFRCANPPL